MNRVLIVNKPLGMTSHDVVERVRRSSRARRVGHAGTLDPTATGVLLVLVGKATRLAQFLADSPKEYRGHMLLGRTTDTQDLAGRVERERPWHDVGRADVERAFARFTGEIEQTPPMVSALKHEGTPLYVLARRGIVVERPTRRVTISRLDLLAFEPPDVEFETVCSKGTYVRTLAADIGEALGCGACLGNLERRRIGPFGIADAAPLAMIESLGRDLSAAGVSMLEALPALPCLRVDDREAATLASGTPVSVAADRIEGGPAEHVRVTRDGLGLLAIARRAAAGVDAGVTAVWPLRVFQEA